MLLKKHGVSRKVMRKWTFEENLRMMKPLKQMLMYHQKPTKTHAVLLLLKIWGGGDICSFLWLIIIFLNSISFYLKLSHYICKSCIKIWCGGGGYTYLKLSFKITQFSFDNY